MTILRETQVIDSDRLSIISGVTTLPEYSSYPSTSTSERTAHVYSHLLAGNVISLMLMSNAPTPGSIPILHDLADVIGGVQLKVTGKCNIHSVSVGIRCFGVTHLDLTEGYRPSNNHDENNFVKGVPFAEVFTTVWRSSSPKKSTSNILPSGTYSWPFSLCMPPTLLDPKNGAEYPLPPTFIHKRSPQYLEYQVEVIVEQKGFFSRGFFSDNYSFATKFHHVPQSLPDLPSSSLRVDACRKNLPLPGPEIDPEGFSYHLVGPLIGRLFNTQPVEVECAFGLSSPNQYPRGYPLPFFITLKSDIPSALHLLATPQAIVVTLKRTLYFRLAESNKRAKYFEETVAKGKCWSYSPLMVLEETKSLQGEIFVKKDMFPSFKSPTIFLEYSVTVSINATGFVRTKPTKDPLASIPVTITTNCVPGYRPPSYAPVPAYPAAS